MSALSRLAARAAGGEEQLEVAFLGERRSTTRFAASRIHQSLEVERERVRVRALVPAPGGGYRVGEAEGEGLRAEVLREALKRAREVAAGAPAIADHPGLPGPGEGDEDGGKRAASRRALSDAQCFYESTLRATPLRRAETLSRLFRRIARRGQSASGALSAGAEERGVANSRGLARYGRATFAEFSFVCEGESHSVSGYGYDAGRDFAALDIEARAERASERCAAARDPREIPPGEYTVILEPPAVAEVLSWLRLIGLGGRAFLEGRGFTAGRLGEALFSPAITLYDDGHDPECFPFPFDAEGVSKRRVDLIERGALRGVVWDTLWAARAGGQRTTGHAAPGGREEGPLPSNLVLARGEKGVEVMVAETERGVRVSRFHYLNAFLEPRRALMTGLTRDGAFYVEGGKERFPLKKLRFTQSMVEALARVEAVGDRPERHAFWSGGGCLVPALKLSRFRLAHEGF